MKSLIPKNWRQLRGAPPRGARFYIHRDGDGFWGVFDDAYALVLGGYKTRAEAVDLKRFCNEYVHKWGDIDFNSFPYDLDQPLHYCDEDEARRYWRNPSAYVEPELPGWNPVSSAS